MPYPSPTTYPSGFLYPGVTSSAHLGDPVALGDVVLNAVDDSGVHWILESFNWDDSPGSTRQVTQRARGHGGTSSEGFFEPMVYTLAGTIVAPTAELGWAARNKLMAAVTLDDFAMVVADGGAVLSSMVHRQDQVLCPRINETDRSFSVQVVADDPRKYGDLVSATTLLPSSSGGATWPVTFPLTFTGVPNTGQVTITNPGNTPAPVWLRVDGPVPAGGWSVTHIGKQQTLTFATALALSAGEFVTVDMEAREVLAQGQAPRSGYVTGRGWFTLDPGENVIAFSAQNFSATAQLTVTTRPAWS